MKKIYLALGLVLAAGLLLPPSLHAYPHSSLTVEPLGFYFGVNNVEFEHVYERQMAAAFRVNFINNTLPDWTASGLGGGVSLRFFPIARLRAPRGLWFGPSIDVLSSTLTYYRQTTTTLLYGLGGEIGYKFMFGRTLAFVISPFASVRYWGGAASVQGVDYPNLHGPRFGLGVSVGLAF